MLKLENSIRGLSFSRVAFDLTIQALNFLFCFNTVNGKYCCNTESVGYLVEQVVDKFQYRKR